MRWQRTRAADSNFDLNLAPFLDVIVAVVSLLLLSATFLEVKMIETSIPQVVEQVIENLNKKKEVDVTLQVSRTNGFTFTVEDQGRKSESRVPLKDGKLDFQGLHQTAMTLKTEHPTAFGLSLAPDKEISMDEIVKALDQTRKFSQQKTVQVKDPESGQVVTTDLMFPNVAFANALGE
jgi:biopolymer transport protein ExbD